MLLMTCCAVRKGTSFSSTTCWIVGLGRLVLAQTMSDRCSSVKVGVITMIEADDGDERSYDVAYVPFDAIEWSDNLCIASSIGSAIAVAVRTLSIADTVTFASHYYRLN